MANEIGFNPFTHGVHGPSSTNPFEDNYQPPEQHYGNQTHQSPEGLQGRDPHMGGGMPPRQPLNFGGHPPGGFPPFPPPLGPDDETQRAVMMQRQQTANNTALAMATAEAQNAQGLNEFLKSMSEMKAKSIKSAGEKLAGLA